MKLFLKIGLINSFFIIKKKNFYYIKYSMFFYKNTTFFKKIKQLSSQSRKFTISYKALLVINRCIKSSIFILETSYGILTHKEALKKHTGGFLLFYIS